MPQDRGKAEEADDMLLPFAERSIEGRESNEERADLPHRVLDSLPRTLHLSPISHGPRDAFGCGGRSVRAARGEPPNGSRLSCGAKLKWSQLEFYYAGCRPFSGLV